MPDIRPLLLNRFRLEAWQRSGARSHRASLITHQQLRARGLTLIELLLALAGMALIGLAIVSMLFAVSYGTNSDKDMRNLVAQRMALRARITASVRESQMVLEHGDGYLVLWIGDGDENGKPNLDEIQLLELDAVNNQLLNYAVTSELLSSPVYEFTDDFATELGRIKGGSNFPARRWADGVEGLDLTLDDADAQSARMVSYRLTLRGGQMSDVAIGAAALRNREEN